jgi:acyl-CoA dehydrogenase
VIRDTSFTLDFLPGVRSYVRDVLVPAEDEVEERDDVPEVIVEDLRQRGYFGWSIPEQYGGGGFTTEELSLAAFELSQASTAFRARVGGNTGIASTTLVNHGTEEQKAQHLPRLASGEITGCFALTEPDAGSDATALSTRAERVAGGWELTGTKCFITNAPLSDLFTVFARTGPQAGGARGISAFLVPRDTPGLTTGEPYRKMGQQGSPVSDVYLDRCRVGDDALLGDQVDEAFHWAMETLTRQRIHLSGHCTGVAIRLLEDSVERARTRMQFGRPIGDNQLIQGMIADSSTDVYASRCMVLETARSHDLGLDVRASASRCKYFTSEAAGRVADRAVQIYGGYGYIAGPGIERAFRDARLFRLYEGTSQIHQLTIAKSELRRGRSEV